MAGVCWTRVPWALREAGEGFLGPVRCVPVSWGRSPPGGLLLPDARQAQASERSRRGAHRAEPCALAQRPFAPPRRRPRVPAAPRPLTSLSLAPGAPGGPVPRSARPLGCAAPGPGEAPHSRGRGWGSARAASPPPPPPPLPRGALVRAGARALRAGTRTRGAHPTLRLAGAAGAGQARLGLRRPGRGARSRLGRRAAGVTGPGRRAGPPAGMRSCGVKKALTSPSANQLARLGGR